ncbi:hypothetical protein, partial [Rhodopseudomonas sp. BAL398]|uniref:hypothetical protein n=1 Tax=Rhodopseudomonas sp. BAL398 TaxID=3034676 RepID=UPI0023E34F22
MRMVVGMGMPVVVRMLMGHRMQVSRRMVRRLGAGRGPPPPGGGAGGRPPPPPPTPCGAPAAQDHARGAGDGPPRQAT